MIFVNEKPKVGIQTCHSIFIENTEKLQEIFKAKVEGLRSTSKACWGWGWGLGEPWWGLVGKAPERFGDFAVRDPLICLFFDRCERKKTARRKITLAMKKL